MLWYKISATIGGSVASNKKKLSKKEFHGWAEYFEYEFNQHTKLEKYLARILQATHAINGIEMPIGYCFVPELEPKIIEAQYQEQKKAKMVSHEEMAADLKGAFGNGK